MSIMLEDVGFSKPAVKCIVPVCMGGGRDCSEEVTGRLEDY